jgi:apolipoprotein N-acyltransferase
VSGVLVALSIPPFGWWPLGWIGLAGIAWRLPGLSARRRARLGVGFGLGQYVLGLLWVQEFSVYGYVALVVVSSLYSVLSLLLVPTGRRRQVALALPAAVVLTDWARDRFPLGGLPLGGMSLGQAAGPLAEMARLGGSLAVTGTTALVGVGLAELARLVLVPGERRRPRLLLPALAAGVALLVAFLSPSGAGGHLGALRIGLVQGGGPRGTRAVDTDPEVVFQRHLQASGLLSGHYDLVLWPEGVIQTTEPVASSPDGSAVAALARAGRATFVVGVDQDLGPGHYLNEAVVWNPDGTVGGSYVKNHLVPFGEYVPLRSLIDRLFNVSEVPRDAVAGHSSGILRTPAGPLAMMISFEVFFDERARGGVLAGGRILVVPTNTASYRSTQVPTQEVAADRLRAIETGRYLVQVTPTGYSTVVSPSGDVLQNTRLDQRAVVSAVVPLRDGRTVYDEVGDLAVLLLSAAAWAATAGAARRGRRAASAIPLAGPAAGSSLTPTGE